MIPIPDCLLNRVGYRDGDKLVITLSLFGCQVLRAELEAVA